MPFASFAATYGPTSTNDQLWQIAVNVRPDATVSVAQTMVALLEKNPTAFKDKNIHGLNAGVILQLPTLAEINAIARKDALQEITAQDAAWKNHKVATSKKSKPTKRVKTAADYKALLQIENKTLQAAQAQNSKVGSDLLNFDAQYQTQLTSLEQTNNLLQQQVTELSQQINALKQNVTTLQQPSKLELFYANYLQNTLGGYAIYIIIVALIVILLLLIWWLSPCCHKKCHCASVAKEKDTEAEYDFMGSEEGIPAKLDLARAYLDMEDHDAASEVLDEVLQKGDEAQKQEAKELLARMV